MASRVQRRLGLVMMALGSLLVAGCPGITGTDATTDENPGLRSFASEGELLSFFKQQASARYSSPVFGSRGLGGLLGAPTATADLAEDSGNESQASDTTSYSTTNLQEAGVDESDVFKSDGTYFYIGHGSTLRIIRAVPADDLAEVGQIELGGTVDEIYLVGSAVIVLGQQYADDQSGSGGAEIYMWPPYYRGTSVVVYAVDVSDPANPAVTGEMELDGMLVSSRLTGGRLYLVLTIVPDLPDNPTTLSIGLMTLDEVLPRAAADGVEQSMVAWQDYYRPNSGDGFYTTAVVTLEASNIEQIVGSVAVMADAGTIYASQEALYITDDEWDAQYNGRQTTVVHKLAFDQDAGARYVGSGSVPGRLLNQFSLGEHAGALRVATHVQNFRTVQDGDISVSVGGVGTATVTNTATVADAGDENTTDGDAGSDAVEDGPVTPDSAGDDDSSTDVPATGGPYNAVFVLAESGDSLQVVGSIENIAPGEQLYSARFMGARGYLVTFEQIDPLFVLDLSDPTSPTVLGELKIPGYSDYLHPFGDDFLIGVGRSVAQTQWGFSEPDAVQLSLFDVSDPANPEAVQQIELGGSYSSSEVSSTHKAFTFLPDSGRLAIPVRLTPDGTSWEDSAEITFDGVVCYQVSSTGFDELGRVACVVDDSDDYVYGWRGWGWNDWRRAAFIGDTLYAVTQDGVRAAPLSDFSATATVELLSATEQ